MQAGCRRNFRKGAGRMQAELQDRCRKDAGRMQQDSAVSDVSPVAA